MKKCKRWIALLILLGIVLFPCRAAAENDEVNLHARAALLMDAATGRVLYEKDGFTPYAVASTTKILTAMIILEAECGEDYVKVSSNAAKQPKVKLYIKEGEEYKVSDLLYSLMLESHNDVAVALAEHVAGSVENFADKMNKKAGELGCKTAHFITPNGLDATDEDGENGASAYDMGLITAYALQNPEFLELIRTDSHSFTDKTGNRSHTVHNQDDFLDLYEGAIGVKTGFTNQAGYCFVGAAEHEGNIYISVVLGCGWPPQKTLKWQDTKELMDFGKENFRLQSLTCNIKYPAVQVLDGQGDDVAAECLRTAHHLLLSDKDEIRVHSLREGILNAPVKKGDVIGWERIYVNHYLLAEFPIVAGEDMKPVTMEFSFYKIWQIFSF